FFNRYSATVVQKGLVAARAPKRTRNEHISCYALFCVAIRHRRAHVVTFEVSIECHCEWLTIRDDELDRPAPIGIKITIVDEMKLQSSLGLISPGLWIPKNTYVLNPRVFSDSHLWTMTHRAANTGEDLFATTDLRGDRPAAGHWVIDQIMFKKRESALSELIRYPI